jgi:hypothetical protein
MRAKLNARSPHVNESRGESQGASALHGSSKPLDMARVSPHSQNPVNKMQLVVLNVVGGACGLLIVCDLVLGQFNGRLNQSVLAMRNQIGQAQQIQNTAQNLVMRIAQAGQTDPALRELLVQHDFKVNQNTNSQNQPSP